MTSRFDTWKSGLVVLLVLAAPSALTGCATHGRSAELRPGADMMAASSAQVADDSAAREPEDYDPWEPFNERMFNFNHGLDRHVLKPVATGWRTVVPEPVREGLQNVLDNVGMPKRLVNNLLQGKGTGAARELGRFLLNSIVGIGGLFDVGKAVDLEKSDEDTGQTLAVYGIGPGPYLMLPFFPPSTVRDAIGSAVDGLLDPVNYLLPLVGTLGRRAGSTVNDRSFNLELFDEVEESVLDLYSAVRNHYLQKRERVSSE